MVVIVAAAPNVEERTRASYREFYSKYLSAYLDVSFIVVLTGGAEPEIIANAGDYNILLGWPHYNSLPSALEAAAYLKKNGKYVEVITLPRPGAEPPVEKIEKTLRLFRLLKEPPRLGLVGDMNRWLVSSHLWGKPDVVIGEEEIFSRSLQERDDGVEEFVKDAESTSYSAEELSPIFRYAKALWKAAAELKLSGVTLGCWCFDFDKVRQRGWTPCISLAVLNDWGITATCEGDLRALYSAVVLHKLSNKPAWIGNINYVEGDLLTLTHDGAPPSMAYRYDIRPRLATGAPAAMRGTAPPGKPITLLRVSEDLKKALLLKGVTYMGERIEACSYQVYVKLTVGDAQDILSANLGNHLAFVLEDVYEEARKYLNYIGAEVFP